MKFKEEFKNLITTQGNRKSLFKFKGKAKNLLKAIEVRIDVINMGIGSKY